ncbi:hypothetical protein L3Y34_012760 [Caenorhabditis briggsae]|uniref:Protein kinase domain-containing protein n=1 Tax=Caenorhabditis briggsae TaxID=6238 RepID=A0AAE8ZS64_CAEBR|nr:hypothetical protein L3Y34_012760 [Caenorhabditis briggsae]
MDARWFPRVPPNSRDDEDKVFLVQSTTSNQNYAMKTSIRRSKDDRIPRSILKEVLMVHHMEHKNVISFIECFSTKTPQKLSPTVGTPGYVAPELLLGSENYGAEIDIWSAGIVVAEIILGEEVIPGGTTRGQLNSIGRVFGGQPLSKWVRWGQFPLLQRYSREVTYSERGSIQNKLDQLPDTEKVNGARLIKKMLQLCPRKRVKACRAQTNSWFLTTPPPAETIPEVVRAVMTQRDVLRR